MSVKLLSGKIFLIITGASRGIGKQIAMSFGSHLGKESCVLLLAKDINALKETAKTLPSNVSVDTASIDLSKAEKDELHEVILHSMKNNHPENFDGMVIVHNVGTIGDITQLTNDMMDLEKWQKHYSLNLFVPAILNAVVMNIFKETADVEKTVINITSLLAIQPGKSFGYYASVKAAREMFFKVFALENPEVNVLSYSPGPVETDMYEEVCQHTADLEVRESFKAMKPRKTILTVQQTINRLLMVLKENKFKSGDRFDYYDTL
ncbi:hypothetical protein KM043_001474 [Ampulex compressa]|nr:hypothetical protein KM043_001474 [Ampulex compressa]